MRILGFTKHWLKLDKDELTTFRFQRRDKDWEVGEQVQLVVAPRTKGREIIGPAMIASKEPKKFCPPNINELRRVSDAEAVEDGFLNYADMLEWLFKTHGKRIFEEPMNKLTLRKLVRQVVVSEADKEFVELRRSVRQAMFTGTGRLTDVPGRDSERPQLEKQGSLFLAAEEQEKMRQWQSS